LAIPTDHDTANLQSMLTGEIVAAIIREQVTLQKVRDKL
jgi:hypothetical protein